MHPGLRKLIKLRARGNLRRIARQVRTPRGAAFTAVGVLVFGLWVVPGVVVGISGETSKPEMVRTIFPFAFLGLCLSQMLLSIQDRALLFSPAEINFVFPGPFSRRQILVYKIARGFGGSLAISLFFSVLLLRHATYWPAAFVGVWMTLMFIQLFNMAVALLTQIVAERLYTKFLKAAVLAMGSAAALGVLIYTIPTSTTGVLDTLKTIAQNPAWYVLLFPFQVSVRVFTAEQILPDFVFWAAAAAAINALMLTIVLRLDANYLEAALAGSRRTYARMERFRKQTPAPVAGSLTARLALPPFPKLWGAGPIARRQLLNAMRAPGVVFAVSAVPIGGVVLGYFLWTVMDKSSVFLAPAAIGYMIYTAFFFSIMLRYDFRAEVDVMDRLKTLPLSPMAIAIGEIAAPTLILAFSQTLFLVFATALSPTTLRLAPVIAFTVPFSILLFSIENFFFLLLPSRHSTSFGDFVMIGKQISMLMVKAFVLGGCILVAASAGGVAFLLGAHVAVTITLAWVVLATCAVASCPCVAWAFKRYDPSLVVLED